MAFEEKLSDFVLGLEACDRKHYAAKLTLADGTVLPDPFLLEQRWTDDISNLPNLSWRDVTQYLIDSPSEFTNKAMKAYKSLEAYNYRTSYHHAIHKKSEFCYIKSVDLVLHVAALLFKLEAAVYFQLNEKRACTSELCAWKASRKSVQPAPLSAIDFGRPKKQTLPAISTRDILFGCVSFIDNDMAEAAKNVHHSSGSDTDSVDETEDSCIPEPLTSLFLPSSINMSDEELYEFGKSRYYLHILAALHFNENLKREVKINTDEKTKVLVTYPKFKNGEAIVREARVEQTFEDINQLYTTLEKALHNCNLEASKIALKEMTPPPLSDSMKKQDRETAGWKTRILKKLINDESKCQLIESLGDYSKLGQNALNDKPKFPPSLSKKVKRATRNKIMMPMQKQVK
eukprot:gene5663-10902_t